MVPGGSLQFLQCYVNHCMLFKHASTFQRREWPAWSGTGLAARADPAACQRLEGGRPEPPHRWRRRRPSGWWRQCPSGHRTPALTRRRARRWIGQGLDGLVRIGPGQVRWSPTGQGMVKDWSGISQHLLAQQAALIVGGGRAPHFVGGGRAPHFVGGGRAPHVVGGPIAHFSRELCRFL